MRVADAAALAGTIGPTACKRRSSVRARGRGSTAPSRRIVSTSMCLRRRAPWPATASCPSSSSSLVGATTSAAGRTCSSTGCSRSPRPATPS
eukprot:5488322-Prymnesium_polylepis.1